MPIILSSNKYGTFPECFQKLLKGLTVLIQRKFKKKSLWSIFVKLRLMFPEESGLKIKYKIPYQAKFRRRKVNFS